MKNILTCIVFFLFLENAIFCEENNIESIKVSAKQNEKQNTDQMLKEEAKKQQTESKEKNTTEEIEEGDSGVMYQDLLFDDIFILRAGYNFYSTVATFDYSKLNNNGFFVELGAEMFHYKFSDNIKFIFNMFFCYSYGDGKISNTNYQLSINHLLMNLFDLGLNFSLERFVNNASFDIYFAFGFGDFIGTSRVYRESTLSKTIHNFYMIYGAGLNLFLRKDFGITFEYLRTDGITFFSKKNSSLKTEPVNLIKTGFFIRF